MKGRGCGTEMSWVRGCWLTDTHLLKEVWPAPQLYPTLDCTCVLVPLPIRSASISPPPSPPSILPLNTSASILQRGWSPALAIFSDVEPPALIPYPSSSITAPLSVYLGSICQWLSYRVSVFPFLKEKLGHCPPAFVDWLVCGVRVWVYQ